MFWGVTCEPGKKYNQIVNDSFHISMASLEPKEKVPENKQVSLMIEQKNAEYLLCTLEHNRVMQVNLDLMFNNGEDVTFYVNGEGIVHITGYILETPMEDSCIAGYDPDEELNNTGFHLEEDKSDEDSDHWSPPTKNDVWASEEVPGKRKLRSKNKNIKFDKDLKELEGEDSDESEDEDYVVGEEEDDMDDEDSNTGSDDDDDEVEDYNEDEESDEQTGKRKRSMQDGNIAKKAKNDVPTNNKKGIIVEEVCVDKSRPSKAEKYGSLNDDSIEESSGDDLETSIGRTPMPHKKLALLKKSKSHSISDGLSPKQKGSEKRDQVMSENKKSALKKSKKTETMYSPTTPKVEYNQKLVGGVEILDIREGAGPVAKSGKFVHIYYVGKLSNGKMFDACREGQKPFGFRLGRDEVVKGLDIGVNGMRVGGKRKMKIPPHMGYGKHPEGDIPANSTLHFTIELKSVS